MIYIYDKKLREFRKVNFSKHSAKVMMASSVFIALLSYSQVNRYKDGNFTEKELEVIMMKHNEFSEEKLIQNI